MDIFRIQMYCEYFRRIFLEYRCIANISDGNLYTARGPVLGIQADTGRCLILITPDAIRGGGALFQQPRSGLNGFAVYRTDEAPERISLPFNPLWGWGKELFFPPPRITSGVIQIGRLPASACNAQNDPAHSIESDSIPKNMPAAESCAQQMYSFLPKMYSAVLHLFLAKTDFSRKPPLPYICVRKKRWNAPFFKESRILFVQLLNLLQNDAEAKHIW
jgi:hypothetical protein